MLGSLGLTGLGFSGGPLVDCQTANEKAKVAPFSLDKYWQILKRNRMQLRECLS